MSFKVICNLLNYNKMLILLTYIKMVGFASLIFLI